MQFYLRDAQWTFGHALRTSDPLPLHIHANAITHAAMSEWLYL